LASGATGNAEHTGVTPVLQLRLNMPNSANTECTASAESGSTGRRSWPAADRK